MGSARVTREALGVKRPVAETTKEVEIPGRGSVLIRSFTKAQQREMRMRAEAEDGAASDLIYEALIVEFGVLEPEMDGDAVKEMFEAWEAEEIDYLVSQIIEFNGLRAEFVRGEVAAFRKG